MTNPQHRSPALVLAITLAATFLMPAPASGTVVRGQTTTAGKLAVSFSNLGYCGNLLSPVVTYPSCEYPANSNVEHWSIAGLWVGARAMDETVHVSIGADDFSAFAGPSTEFGPRFDDSVTQLSNDPTSLHYSTEAVATQQLRMPFDDLHSIGGDPGSIHVPLGLRVHMEAFAYDQPHVDDFVIVDFIIENISGDTLRDVYIGWYNEFTVGNTTVTIPGGEPSWNFYDDIKGFYGPGDVIDDLELRMMYAYDPDTDGGAAPSWIGTRLLGTDVAPATFTYRQWRFRSEAWPETDVEKYETMASGQVDVGAEFEVQNSWVSMFSVGPWGALANGETAHFTIAVVGGMDAGELLLHSRAAQITFDRGFVPVPVQRTTFGRLKAGFGRQ